MERKYQMSKREHIKTPLSEIIAYWEQHVDECGLSVDWAEAGSHCWRCGYEKNLERCHIIPDSLGGKDEPSNLVLLCKRCHAEGPNVADPEIMWDWIRAYGVPLYGTFWIIRGMKEYQFIYHKTIRQELTDVLMCAGVPPDSEEAINVARAYTQEMCRQASVHFAQPYFNTATLAGIFRMLLKAFAQKYGVAFPIPSQNQSAPPIPWWVE